MRLKGAKEDLEVQGNKGVYEMKMKRNDDSKTGKKKDDRKPVSFKAQKGCKGLDCFFCSDEEEKE